MTTKRNEEETIMIKQKIVTYFHGSEKQRWKVSTAEQFRNTARAIISDLRAKGSIPTVIPTVEKTGTGGFSIKFTERPWEGARADFLCNDEWYTASAELVEVVENLMTNDDDELWLTVANRRGASEESWDSTCDYLEAKYGGIVQIFDNSVVTRLSPLSIVEQVIVQLVDKERGVYLTVESNPPELPHSTIVWRDKR